MLLVSAGGMAGNYSIKRILTSAFHTKGLCVFLWRNFLLLLYLLLKEIWVKTKCGVLFFYVLAVWILTLELVQHHLEGSFKHRLTVLLPEFQIYRSGWGLRICLP